MEFASGDETNAEFHAQAIMEVESNPDTRTLTAETTIDLGTTTDDDGNEVENKKVISFPLSWNEDGKTALSVFYVLDGKELHLAWCAEVVAEGNQSFILSGTLNSFFGLEISTIL